MTDMDETLTYSEPQKHRQLAEPMPAPAPVPCLAPPDASRPDDGSRRFLGALLRALSVWAV